MGQESAISDRSFKTRGAELYEVTTWTFLGLSAAFVLGLRIYLAWDLPLWLDESWTAVLSAAPTLQSFVHQMWLDSNAPLYYFLMWLWPVETSFGLKIPSIVFMIASSCIAYFFRPVERKQALFWGVLLIFWSPGMS